MTEPEPLDERDLAVARRLEADRPALPEGAADRLRQVLGTAVVERFTLLRTMRTRAASFIAFGGLLFAIAVLGIAGVGPFAA